MAARLHSCQDLGHLESPENDANCLKVLLEYTGVFLLGSGDSSNVVLQIARPDTKPLAVKILVQDDDSRNEIRVSCAVNDQIATVTSLNSDRYSADTNSNTMFCQTFGYIACGPPPEEWQRVIPYYEEEEVSEYYKKNYFLVMELGEGQSLTNVTYRGEDSLVKLKSFLFEVFFGLAQAYAATGFQHNDLHDENVLVTQHSNNDRVYSIGEVSFEIHQRDYPKIIDYGKSTFNAQKEELHVIFKLIWNCKDKYWNDYIVWPWLDSLYKNGLKLKTFSELLTSKSFKDLRVISPRKKLKSGPSLMECQICNDPATRVYKHAPLYGFCDYGGCVKRMGPIGGIICNK